MSHIVTKIIHEWEKNPSSQPYSAGVTDFLVCGNEAVLISRNFCFLSYRTLLILASNSAATCSRWFLARGFFYPEDGSDTFLRNVGSHKIYTAPHP
jgi:hypothetical protein